MKQRKPDTAPDFEDHKKQVCDDAIKAQNELEFVNAVDHFAIKNKDKNTKNDIHQAFHGKKGQLRAHFSRDQYISKNSIQAGNAFMMLAAMYGSMFALMPSGEGSGKSILLSAFGALFATGAAITGVGMKRKADIRKQIDSVVSEHKRLPGPEPKP